MIERKFIEDHIKSLEIEEYLAKVLEKADYSHTDIQITPLSTRLVVHVGRPGIAIGRAGKNIEMITNILSEKFGVKNPQLDIQSIENPDLDATYVAHQISSAIERYVKPNRITNIYLRNIMRAGAYGAEIQISGKISGGRGRTDKKQVGYIKKSGEFVIDNVDRGFSVARMKPGVLGIKVMIMKNLPESMLIEKRIKDAAIAVAKEAADKKAAERKAKEAKADEKAEPKDDKKVDDAKEDKADDKKEVKKEIKKESKAEPKKEEKKATVKKEKETKAVKDVKDKKETVKKEKAKVAKPVDKKETTKKEVKKEEVVTEKKVADKVKATKKEETKAVAKEEKK